MESEKIDSSTSFFPFLFLPVDLIRLILSEFCTPFDLRCLSLVGNQELVEFTREEFVWKRLVGRREEKEMKEEEKIAESWKEHFRLTWIEQFEELESWKAHSDFIYCLVDLGEGIFASGSRDETIKIWELLTLNCLRTLEGHIKGVTCLAKFKEDFLVSGSYDRTIELWNFKTGECIRTFEHSDCVYSLCILGDNIVSGSYKEIKVWNSTTGECLRTLQANGCVFSLLEFEGNFVVGDEDNINLRDGKTFEVLKSFNNHTGNIGHRGFILALIILNGKLISGGGFSDGMMKIWDLGTRECKKTLSPHDRQINSFVVSSDGKLITCSNDKTIKVLDPTSSWKCIKTFTGHTDWVKCVIFVQNKLISCSDDFTIKVWGTK